MLYDLIIIGAGAAGLFAAANVPSDKRVLLLEQTAAPGQKLLLAGSGQCNLTNSGDIAAFLDRYGSNGKRLRPVLFPFSNLALMAWFEERGLPLITRPDGKVFPASLDAQDVLHLLLDQIRKNGVEIRLNTPATTLTRAEDHWQVETPTGTIDTRCVLVTTGGASYPATGSDGRFFGCLEALGLDVIPPRPALCPVFVHDYPYSALTGISFVDAVVTLTTDTKPLRAAGSLLLTHRGFSGPVILNNARAVRQGAELTINYLPGQDPAILRRGLMEAATGSAQQVVTLLEAETRLPRRFLEVICGRANIATDTKAARLSGGEMGELARLLTADTYT
ncbi:MAG: aminoacetone oxidase family FAD-binding enzyme, partial [Oscillospiraceae bacterium]|nr:aminoacetone oxidase family FAD-binding enzyme [Oscillospiraceae bacterium]